MTRPSPPTCSSKSSSEPHAWSTISVNVGYPAGRVQNSRWRAILLYSHDTGHDHRPASLRNCSEHLRKVWTYIYRYTYTHIHSKISNVRRLLASLCSLTLAARQLEMCCLAWAKLDNAYLVRPSGVVWTTTNEVPISTWSCIIYLHWAIADWPWPAGVIFPSDYITVCQNVHTHLHRFSTVTMGPEEDTKAHVEICMAIYMKTLISYIHCCRL